MRPKNDSSEKLTFKEKVSVWAMKVRVKPKQIRLQEMSRKWASCSLDGRVTFSDDLLWESHAFQDYVIVHELLHLKVPNHGKLFKSLLSAHFPGYKDLIPKHAPANAGDWKSAGTSNGTIRTICSSTKSSTADF